jgi:hypothetical protein
LALMRPLRSYVLFFIELGSRRGHVAGCTPNPNAPCVIQQARQLSWTFAGRLEPMRFLICDRDQKFTDRFDDVFRSESIEVVRTPFRAPKANGVAERFVRTGRSECFDVERLRHEDTIETAIPSPLNFRVSQSSVVEDELGQLRVGVQANA